jgi:hypothetical protein
MALRNNLPSGRLKKRLWGSRWSNFSRCRNAMRIHFLYLGHRKKRFSQRRLSDVLRNEWPWELIICLLDVLKIDFNGRLSDVSRCRLVMQNHFQHLGNRIKWLSACRLSDVICMALSTHNLPSERFTKRLWWSRWSDVSRCPNTMRNHFLNLGQRRKDLTKSLKCCFK